MSVAQFESRSYPPSQCRVKQRDNASFYDPSIGTKVALWIFSDLRVIQGRSIIHIIGGTSTNWIGVEAIWWRLNQNIQVRTGMRKD